MEFSNKSLVVMAFLILGFSIFGSIYSLNLLEDVTITGRAHTASGDVNLTIGATVSIALNDSGIDFGTCTIIDSVGIFDSSLTSGSVNNTNCTGGSEGFPTNVDNITISNDGNVPVSVNASITTLPTNMYGATAVLSLKGVNASASPGCHGVSYNTYNLAGNFSGTGSQNALDVCSNLGYASGNDTMVVYAKYWINLGATSAGGDSTDVVFRAEQV